MGQGSGFAGPPPSPPGMVWVPGFAGPPPSHPPTAHCLPIVILSISRASQTAHHKSAAHHNNASYNPHSDVQRWDHKCVPV